MNNNQYEINIENTRPKNIQTGISARIMAAAICPQSTENFVTKFIIPAGNVICDWRLMNINANKSSDHAAVKTKPNVAPIPGKQSGNVTFSNA